MAATSEYVCITCGTSFSQRWSLRRHKKIHAGETLACEECDKNFSSKNTLNRHKINHHTTKGSYLCCICGKSFNRRHRLLDH